MAASEPTCFLVCVRTGENCAPEAYTAKAEALRNLLEVSIQSDLGNLCGTSVYEKCEIHVEVTLDYDKQSVDYPEPWCPTSPMWELTGRAILEFHCSSKVTLDKPKLTRLLRTSPLNPWGVSLKVTKQSLPCDWQSPPSLPCPEGAA